MASAFQRRTTSILAPTYDTGASDDAAYRAALTGQPAAVPNDVAGVNFGAYDPALTQNAPTAVPAVAPTAKPRVQHRGAQGTAGLPPSAGGTPPAPGMVWNGRSWHDPNKHGSTLIQDVASLFNNPLANPIQYGIDQGARALGNATGLPGISNNPINNFATPGGTIQAGADAATGKTTPLEFIKGAKNSPFVNPVGYGIEQGAEALNIPYADVWGSLGSLPGAASTIADGGNIMSGGKLDGGNVASSPFQRAAGDGVDAIGDFISSLGIPGLGGGAAPDIDAMMGGVGGGGPTTAAPDFSGINNTLATRSNSGAQQGVLNAASRYAPTYAAGAQQQVAGYQPTSIQQAQQAAANYNTTGINNATSQVNSFQPTQTGAALSEVGAFDASGAQRAAASQLGAANVNKNTDSIGRSVQAYDPTVNQRQAADDIALSNPTYNQGQAQAGIGAYNASAKPQTDVMQKVAAFGPQSAEAILAELEAFRQRSEGPSKAELLLKQSQDDAMSNALSLARSGRGGAGQRARALQVAIGENAATSQQSARDLSLLRAQEEQDFRNQLLTSLGLSGQVSGAADTAKLGALQTEAGLAQSLDEGTLRALGLSTDLSKNMDQALLQKLGLRADLSKSMDASSLAKLGLGADVAKTADANILAKLGLQQGAAQGIDQSDLSKLGLKSNLATSFDDSTLRQLGLTAQLGQAGDELGLGKARLQGDLGIAQADAELRRLGISADLARSMDDSTLRALGISADTANAIRNAEVTERGQTLNAQTSMADTQARLRGDEMANALGYSQIAGQNARLEAELGYKLTPEQQLLVAALGGGASVLASVL